MHDDPCSEIQHSLESWPNPCITTSAKLVKSAEWDMLLTSYSICLFPNEHRVLETLQPSLESGDSKHHLCRTIARKRSHNIVQVLHNPGSLSKNPHTSPRSPGLPRSRYWNQSGLHLTCFYSVGPHRWKPETIDSLYIPGFSTFLAFTVLDAAATVRNKKCLRQKPTRRMAQATRPIGFHSRKNQLSHGESSKLFV